MPNGVICGGALDGSNHAGEIVTCHAMTARPAGSFAAAVDAAMLKARSAQLTAPTNAGRKRRTRNEIIRSLPAARPPQNSPTVIPGFVKARIIDRVRGLSV